MKFRISQLFLPLKPLQRVEWLLMTLFAILLVVSWSWAVKALLLMLIFLIPKLIWQHRVGNPALGRSAWWALGLVMAYFAIYTLSLLWTTNLKEGTDKVVTLLPFLAMPLIFMLSDTSYLCRGHIRLLMHLFCLALMVRFCVCLCTKINYMIANDLPYKNFFIDFDTLHHSYLSMYTLLALAFLLTELMHYRRQLPRYMTVIVAVEALLLCAYTYIAQSRAGILCMATLGLAMVLYMLTKKAHRKLGIICLAAGALLLGASLMTLSGVEEAHRLGFTAKKASSGRLPDTRVELWQHVSTTIVHNLPWGCGIGDRWLALLETYPEGGFINKRMLRDWPYNPHNQVLDTFMTVGIPGLLILLGILLLPWMLWLRKGRPALHYRYLLPLMLITTLSIMFESAFERQMGLLYFAFFYCLFFQKAEA